jgi:hypothetical protein
MKHKAQTRSHPKLLRHYHEENNNLNSKPPATTDYARGEREGQHHQETTTITVGA